MGSLITHKDSASLAAAVYIVQQTSFTPPSIDRLRRYPLYFPTRSILVSYLSAIKTIAAVLIGDLPSATVGSTRTCVGPPDTIATDSTTVLTQGKPAARMGVTTAHGGKIIIGCPTVLIG
ncbi:Zn-binding Pro-Ala-Ala-Arg (PAAR) domain-containing protein, incolved in TypeVI secretion [Microbulbifer donghaiensis]|uniref:Zn-binding Pro-Ala-Ala-Arg (PAAR) domain-containing protein, incolved in TypeVI secretion n=1 Tax=Microbulbifer donghaiensis TaxID=494016 RepID=A0A1M5EE71_9GAMM|nr:PAAR domain-containing protein [Microbulbifer donghaiensis]SHF77381.1 Zn-binding Pro-Ala-Ala-Arg (PAAR) domain-containing protein, incolved in TypeVI secretion [Microbulbifer donghaiensis]